MVETTTTWQDSGHDCEHCGGEVWQRTDRLPDGSTEELRQCRACGCQWSVTGDWVRVGNGRACQAAHHQQTSPTGMLPRRLFIGLGILLLLMVARLGGIGALRFLIPLALIGAAVWAFMRWGREFY